MNKVDDNDSSVEKHHDRLMKLFTLEVKNVISQLYMIHVQPKRHWSTEFSLFNEYASYRSRNRREVIIPDIKLIQVPILLPRNEIRVIDFKYIQLDTYYTWHPILFIYEFSGHNSISLYKINIALWCETSFEEFGDESSAELDMEKFEDFDGYLEKLINLLDSLPDLKTVNLFITLDKNLLTAIRKHSNYFHMSDEFIKNLCNYSIDGIKLDGDNVSERLKNTTYKLEIILEFVESNY